MTYATQTDLIAWASADELQQLTDLSDPPAGAIDAARVTAALEDADAEINSYLAQRTTTPLSIVPRQVKNLACSIARYRLAKDHASDRVTNDYNEAIAWLGRIAKGLVSLGDDTSAAPDNNAGTPRISAPDRRFTRDSLKGF